MGFYNNDDFDKWSDLFYETLSSCKEIEEAWRNNANKITKKGDANKNKNVEKQDSCNYCKCNDWEFSMEGEGKVCDSAAKTLTQDESKYYQWLGEPAEELNTVRYRFETDILENPVANVEISVDGFNQLTIKVTEGFETKWYSERTEKINRFNMPDTYAETDEVIAKYVGADRHLVIYLTHRVVADKGDKIRVIKIE